MHKSRWLGLLAAGAFALTTLTVFAQTDYGTLTIEGDDPAALRLFLEQYIGTPYGENATVTLGQLPADGPLAALTVPEGIQVVGTVSRAPLASTNGFASAQVYARTNLQPDAAVAAFDASVTASGYTLSALNQPPPGGFGQTLNAYRTYCSPEETTLNVNANRLGERTDVYITASDAPDPYACGGEGLPEPYFDPTTLLPQLTPPAGAEVDNAGTFTLGAQSEAVTATALLVGEGLEPAAVSEAYGAQLTAAGWTQGETNAAAPTATTLFTFTGGPDDATYDAVLTATQQGDGRVLVSLYFSEVGR